MMFYDNDWRKANIPKRAAQFINPSVAETFGDAAPEWQGYPTTTHWLCEIKDGKKLWADTHRSTWQRIFASFDGWKRFEKERLPDLKNPDVFYPVKINSDDIIITAFKKAEFNRDNDNYNADDLILRIYCVAKQTDTYKVSFGIPIAYAWICDMAEQNKTQLEVIEDSVFIKVDPFEIMTLRIRVDRVKHMRQLTLA